MNGFLIVRYCDILEQTTPTSSTFLSIGKNIYRPQVHTLTEMDEILTILVEVFQ
jgi:hypothetical protein